MLLFYLIFFTLVFVALFFAGHALFKSISIVGTVYIIFFGWLYAGLSTPVKTIKSSITADIVQIPDMTISIHAGEIIWKSDKFSDYNYLKGKPTAVFEKIDYVNLYGRWAKLPTYRLQK